MMTDQPDTQLLASLRAMWEQFDPPPADLAEDVLVTLATRDLADEYRELHLISDQHSLQGVRGATPRILEFAVEPVRLLLRVDAVGELHRVDGWLAPPRAGRVVLEVDGVESASTEISPQGRFEFPGVAGGRCRLVIHASGEDGFSVTGEFTI